jgi:hypothetical protein
LPFNDVGVVTILDREINLWLVLHEKMTELMGTGHVNQTWPAAYVDNNAGTTINAFIDVRSQQLLHPLKHDWDIRSFSYANWINARVTLLDALANFKFFQHFICSACGIEQVIANGHYLPRRLGLDELRKYSVKR